MSRVVVGLDIALSTGWASADDSGLLRYGALKFRGEDGKRYLDVREKLGCLLDDTGAELLAYEQVRFCKYYLAYGSFRAISAVILLVCQERNIPTMPVTTVALKKFWTGTGHANKTRMCTESRRRTGAEVYDRTHPKGSKTSEDVADAIAVAFWGVAQAKAASVSKPRTKRGR